MLLLALLSCDSRKPPAEDDSQAAPTCEPVDPPGEEEWVPAGLVPALGFFSLESAGERLYLGSHNAGSWRLEDQDWAALQVAITHTSAALVADPQDPDRIYRSAGGMVSLSEDYGRSWEPTAFGDLDGSSDPQLVWAMDMAAWDSQRLWVVDAQGESAFSLDGAQSQQEGATLGLPPPDGYHFVDRSWKLLGPPDEEGRVLFTDGQLLWSSDVDLSAWVLLREDLASGHALVRDGQRIWVGSASGVAWSEDEGESWTEIELDIHAHALAVDEGQLLVAGEGQLLRLEEGSVLEESELPDEVILMEVHQGELWLAGHQGLWVSADGSSWSPSTVGLEDPGMAVIVGDPDCPERVWTGSRCTGGLFFSDQGGQDWHRAEYEFHYVMAFHHDPNVPVRRWVVSDDALMLSLDEGESWTRRHEAYHFHGFALHPSDSELLLLGSVGSGEWADESGSIYRSADLGLSWSKASGLPQTESSAHSFLWLDEERVLAGFFPGGDVSHAGTEAAIGLYISEDRGKSFEAVPGSPSTDIAWLEQGPGRVWAATLDGLFWSEDGLSWFRITSEAMLSVGFRGDVGLALTSAGGIYRSTDGGLSWADWSEGLPPPGDTQLAQVALSADARTAWVTIYEQGVWMRGTGVD